VKAERGRAVPHTRAIGEESQPVSRFVPGSSRRPDRESKSVAPEAESGARDVRFVPEDEIMMLLIPGDMWNRMLKMGDAAGASGPIALVNIALERLRIALEIGD